MRARYRHYLNSLDRGPEPQPVAAERERKATIQLPTMRRDAQLRAASFNEDDNTIEIVWTTGARVRRRDWFDGVYDEALEVTAKAVRLDRLNAGAPFLNTHASYDLTDVIGSIVPGSAKIIGGKGVARVLLSDAPADADVVAKIRSGVIKNISVGYRVHEVVKTERDGDVPLHTVTDWEPLEISAVPIPADPGAQVRAGTETYPCIILSKEASMPTTKTTPASADAVTIDAERSRASTITDLATRAGLPEIAAPAIASDVSVDQFRTDLLNRLVDRERAQHPGGPGDMIGAPATVADNSFDVRRSRAMECAILHRIAPQTFKFEPDAAPFIAKPLLELARDTIEWTGRRTYGMTKMQLVTAALAQRSMGGLHSSSDFPVLLSNVANKVLRTAYQAAPQTFRPLVRVGSVPDFKEQTRAQLGEAPMLEKVNEHGEFKRGTIGEAGEKFRVATFGKVIGLTRQAIINDDLGAFQRLPVAFGRAAAQLEADLVWGEILGNPTMADTPPRSLFHADHANLAAAGAAISLGSVSDGRLAMSKQTGLDGKTILNLSPSFIIVPAALLTTAEQLLAPLVPAQTVNAVPESIRRIEIISDPRLDNGIASQNVTGSATAWYLAASVGQVDIVELAYLEGAEGLYTETRAGFDVDGVEVKVRMDVGAKVLDWRGLYKNPGA